MNESFGSPDSHVAWLSSFLLCRCRPGTVPSWLPVFLEVLASWEVVSGLGVVLLVGKWRSLVYFLGLRRFLCCFGGVPRERGVLAVFAAFCVLRGARKLERFVECSFRHFRK